jgi:hypothetical protein
MDFTDFKFRASLCLKLLTGQIELTEFQRQEIKDLIQEKTKGINANGNKVKWTQTKADKLEKLFLIDSGDLLPKTLTNELRAIHRAETHKRYFGFINKYVTKGTDEEDEAITVYQAWRNLKGKKSFFVKNSERFYTDFFSGEPDLTDNNTLVEVEEGYDVKCSWELDTFPYPEDKLDPAYECQNQVYMEGTGAKSWVTAYILVNASQDQIFREKQKYFYAYGMPEDGHEKYAKLLKKYHEIEIRLIFDRKRFDTLNPHANIEITAKEWEQKGYDIQLEDRVVEFEVQRSEAFIDNLKKRVEFSRKYLNNLNKK